MTDSQTIEPTTYLTDGGLETDLIFNRGIDLPHFSAFVLINNPIHRPTLRSYYSEYLDIAVRNGTGFILESPTWRASPYWGSLLGYSQENMRSINRSCIGLMKDLKDDYQHYIPAIYISGQIGPWGDGYQSGSVLRIEEYMEYHSLQVGVFAEEGVDRISAITMTNVLEAIGITLAARKANVPVVVSFTVETNGLLPSGENLMEAIEAVDKASGNYPLYYMINCAHPSHFLHQLLDGREWNKRVRGIRANASVKSHAELDNSTTIDKGNAEMLAKWHTELKKALPELNVYGGCCGTDAAHLELICNHVL